MIKFFRKIRYNLMEQNKTGKYFKYAIGEILLVVIGILIALQINNWNENRKDRVQEIATLNKFLQDLKADSIYYQSNLKTIKDINKLHKDIYAVGFQNKSDIVFIKPAYIRRALMYYPIAKDNDPNITNKINNEGLREYIQAYYREMKGVLEANNEFEAVVFEIRAFLRKLKILRLDAWFDSDMDLGKESTLNNEIITSEDLIKVSKNEDFQQLLFESSLKLNDLRESLEKHVKSNSILITKIKMFTQIND